MNDFETFEANFATPFAEVSPGIIKGIAEFDEHVQGHKEALEIFAAGVVDKRFDGNKRATRRQGIVGRADEVHLFLEIPVVEDHAHCNDVGFRQRVFEEIAGCGSDALTQAGAGDMFFGDRLNDGQVVRDTFEV